MSTSEKSPVRTGIKLVACLLIAGGIVGLGMISTELLQMSLQQQGALLFLLAFAAIFAWSAWQGIRLWRRKPDAYKWAKVLFAAQIPILALPGFAYEFFTGMTIRLMGTFSGAKLGFYAGFQFGAGANLYLSPEIQNMAFGINLVAVAVLVYLLRLPQPGVISPEANAIEPTATWR